MSSSPKVARRRFLKHLGAGVVAATAASAGYYYNRQLGSPSETITIPKGWESATTYLQNHQPIASFRRRPYYLNPTDEQTIQFTNTSYDPDGDPLSTTWLIDHKEVSHERDYSTKLAEGEHWVTMRVSDGKEETSAGDQVTVKSDQTCPTKQLHLKHKGVRYYIGPITPEFHWPEPPTEEMNEQLDTIHDELGCNTISVVGGAPSQDKMIQCAQLAVEKGFDRVTVQPSYVNATVDETISRVRDFANMIRPLREKSEKVVYMIGHEFCFETAIVPGNNWFERFANAIKGIGLNDIRRTVPKMIDSILDACKTSYPYEITYAAEPGIEVASNLIPWSRPEFESVGVDAYIQENTGWTPDWVIDLLSRMKKYRKPVYSTDWGMASFEGADQFGGLSIQHLNENRSYDEEPQGRYIQKYCNMLNQARIDGCYWVQYNDVFDKGYGLYNPQTLNRKKGFHIYKSYQRAS